MNLTTLPEPQNNNLILRSSIPSEHEMMVYHTMAEQAVSSKMYKGIGEKSGVMMIMLSARELGIPPMQALNGGLNIIQGKVEISARMMGALIRKAGHDFVPKKETDTECVIWGKRGDNGRELEVSFTLADAQRAGLVKQGGGWTKFPKDMCFARALSRLARQLFSDVIGIGYVEGEIRATEAITSVPDAPVVVEEIEVVDENELVEKYLQTFDKDDKHLALEYMKIVQKHFEWTLVQTIQELLKDTGKLFDKFSAWKSKLKQAG